MEEEQRNKMLLEGWTNEDMLALLSPQKNNLNDCLKLAGWSPNSLTTALTISPSSPSSNHSNYTNSTNSTQFHGKRSNLIRTPENNSRNDYLNENNSRKMIDLKDTPTISSSPSFYSQLTSHSNFYNNSITTNTTTTTNNNNNNNNEDNNNLTPTKTINTQTIISLVSPEKEVEDLSQVFAEHSIKYTSPKKPFQPARIYFEETNKKVNIAESINLDETLPNGFKLYPFQKKTIRRCLAQERTILALDMGLGKTIISLMWARLQSQLLFESNPIRSITTIVLCPCTLVSNWTREATSLGFRCFNFIDCNPSIFETNSSYIPTIIILPWSQLPSPDALLSRISNHQNSSISSISSRITRYLIIADEAHYIQSLCSQRTQATLRLTLNVNCSGVILATGTPMKNGRPINLLPLLIAIKHPLGRDRRGYEIKYCDAKKTRFNVWDTSGAKNLDELREKVGETMIRMTKEECLPEITQLKRIRVKATISQSSQREYDNILKKYKLSQQNKYKPNGRYQNSTGLEMLSSLRQLTSLAKVPFTLNLIEQMLLDKSNSSPIVVFVWFRETAITLIHHLRDSSRNSNPIRSAYITGDIIKQEERQQVVDLFQDGQLDVLICSFGVGSTGLTLTKSSRIILLDRPWTPGDAKQAEDRIRRIGQQSKEVISIWIAGFSIDDSLDQLLQKKDKNSSRVIETIESNAALSGSDKWFENICNKNITKDNNNSNNKDKKESVGVIKKNKDIRNYFQVDDTLSIQEKQNYSKIQENCVQDVEEWWKGDNIENNMNETNSENIDPQRRNNNNIQEQSNNISSIMSLVLRDILL